MGSIRFNEWHKPAVMRSGSDGVRLYLTRRSLQGLVQEAGVGEHDPSLIPDRGWLEGTRTDGHLSIRFARPEADAGEHDAGTVDGLMREALMGHLAPMLSDDAGDQIEWRGLRDALYAHGMVYRRGQPVTQPPHQRDDAEPANADGGAGSHTAGSDTRSQGRERVHHPTTAILGRRETQPMADALAREATISVVRDHSQYADVVAFNDAGEELVIVRQRLPSGEGSNPGKALFEHANHLGFFAHQSDHRTVVLILLEGEAGADPAKRRREGIEGALAYLLGCDHLGVITTESLDHSADVILRAIGQFRRSASPGEATEQARSLVDHKCMALEAVPGVSRKMAMALLERFGSIANVAAATREQLEQVEGVGSKRSGSIQRVFQSGG